MTELQRAFRELGQVGYMVSQRTIVLHGKQPGDAPLCDAFGFQSIVDQVHFGTLALAELAEIDHGRKGGDQHAPALQADRPRYACKGGRRNRAIGP